jgi:AcrR family transcriptional regulator
MRTRAEQKAETRARLLDAAALLVASKGVEGATVDAIAAAAGVTTGALYASFRTKAELLAAVVTERPKEDATGVPLATLAKDFGERWAHLLDGDPVGSALTIELLVAAGRDDDLRAVVARELRSSTGALEQRIVDERFPLRLSVHETALLMQVLAAGTIAIRQVLGDELPPSLLTHVVELLRADT